MEEAQNNFGRFLDPAAIIAQLDIAEGSVAIDFGCGPGYFSIPFAKAVGKDGIVWSLDILPQALETVAGKAKNSGIANITTKRVNFEKEKGTKLEDACADWVILKDVLFQNKDKAAVIKEAYRVLKNGGKVILVEWNMKNLTVGPEKELRISQSELEKMFANQGFIAQKDIVAGDFHYAFVASKN
ncbi:MAG: class I SAM-dependent methyltransferase [bacterium]